MNDNKFYQDGYEFPDGQILPKPEDWGGLERILADRRPSLSPSIFTNEKFREFKRADDQVSVEADTREKVISQLLGATRETSRIGREIIFGNIANILPYEAEAVGDRKGPVGGRQIKPDYYYGAHPGLFDNREIRNELSQYIIPPTESTQPMVPNFFIEAKGPKGSYGEALNQACIDGAIGTRGMHKLQTYRQKVPNYNNKTSAISSIYKDGRLKMYAHHVGQPNGPGTEPEYYMNQLGAYAMTHNRDTLRQGMTAFRNGVDWAGKQRNAAIEHAKAVANGVTSPNDNDTDDEEGEVNAGEDSDDLDDEDNNKEDELITTAVNPILSSFTSESPFSVGQTSSRRSRTAHQESDTSADEPDRRKLKRSKREKHSR